MTASTASITPGMIAPGVVPAAEPPPWAALDPCVREAFDRACRGDYHAWLEHVRPAAGCTRPIRLSGVLNTVATSGPLAGQVISSVSTLDMPDAVIYKPCGNRRARACPACSTVYQHDAFHLLNAGLVGGRGVPDTVCAHPAVFATLTAPSFGPVHTRVVTHHACRDRQRCTCRPQPCRVRRILECCPHGRPQACGARHAAGDPALGQPLCLDCYDHAHQVVWNLFSGELWRRTKQAIDRHLASLARRRGIPKVELRTAGGRTMRVSPVRVSHGKAAEFQTRGAVHFHALLRLDGVDPADPAAVVPPPAGFTADDLADAVRAAVAQVRVDTPPHPERPDGWPVVWGAQLDVRTISLTGRGDVTYRMVAGYLAKYATKSTEATGHTSTRITLDNLAAHLHGDGHTARLISACWQLGRNPDPLHPDPENPYPRLRRWAHMLGFPGHFLTKARRFSITFGHIRAERATWQRAHQNAQATDGRDTGEPADTTTLVIGVLTYAGIGWHTSGDALLANTAAAQAREYARAGREETAHLLATTGLRLAAA